MTTIKKGDRVRHRDGEGRVLATDGSMAAVSIREGQRACFLIGHRQLTVVQEG